MQVSIEFVNDSISPVHHRHLYSYVSHCSFLQGEASILLITSRRTYFILPSSTHFRVARSVEIVEDESPSRISVISHLQQIDA